MVYNYDTQQPILYLQDFLDELVVEVLMSVFFQHSLEKEIDILRLPLIIPKSVRGNMVNYDVNKKNLLEKEFKYDEETLIKYQEMIDEKEVNINNSLTSGEVFKTYLVNLSKVGILYFNG